MTLSAALKGFATACALTSLTAGAAFAQSSAPQRLPETGLPIIDCAPESPAPQNSCVVRIPPKYAGVSKLTFDSDADGAGFRFLKSDNSDYPSNVKASATAVVIDATIGNGGRRNARWSVERGHIVDFIEALPDGELVSVYLFDDELELMIGLTNKTRAASVVSGIEELSGVETLIGPNVRQVITEMGAREDILLKNIVVVSDGDEEGSNNGRETGEFALQNGVSLSAMATVWASGRAATRGTGFMYELTEATKGSFAEVPIARGTDGSTATRQFSEDFVGSISQSGLIVPNGDPFPADILLTIQEPIAGQDGFRDRLLRVAFVPTAASASTDKADAEADKDAESKAAEADLLFGFPALYVYIAGAILALLLLLLLFLLLRRKSDDVEDDDWDDSGADLPDDGGSTEVVPAPPSPQARPWVVLMRDDTGERIPVARARATIGRSSENDVVLNDTTVSRYHAQLQRGPNGTALITDTNSANGILLNGKKIKGQQTVNTGDNLTFGSLTVKMILQ